MRPQSHLGGRGKGRGGRPFRSGVHGQEARFIEIPLSPDLSPLLVPHGEREILCRYQWPHIRVPRVCASTAPCGTRGRSSAAPSRQVNPEASQVLSRRHSRPCAKPHRRAQPLQSEARSAKNAPESTICGVLPNRPTLQVVYVGWSQFPFPETPLAG